MKLLRVSVALLLAALWLPATLHCQWEWLLDGAPAGCCTHAESSHGGSGCGDEVCASIESGHFRAPEPDDFCQAPARIPLPMVGLTPGPIPTPLEFPVGFPAVLPSPELTPGWHFLLRATGEVRAPSLVG